MFSLFKKKPKNSGGFNILDSGTLEYASDSVFVLNGKTVIEMGENAEAFTEKNMVKAITDVICGISRNDGAKEKIQKKGRRNIIERLVNNMALEMSFAESIDEMIHWLNSSGDESGRFDILDFNSWKYASLRPFFWKDKKLFSAKDGKALTEEDIVELFQAIFGFLERNGDKVSHEVKQTGINNVLNRMVKCQSDPEYDIMQQEKMDSEFIKIYETEELGLQNKIRTALEAELQEGLRHGYNVDAEIVKKCQEQKPKADIIVKLPQKYVLSNTLIDHIAASQTVLTLTDTETTNLFLHKIAQLSALALEKKLPVDKMKIYYDELSQGNDDDDARNSIWSKENYHKFDEILDIMNKDIIYARRSEVFMLDRLVTLTDKNQWKSTAHYLKDSLLKYDFSEFHLSFAKDYDEEFRNTINSMWTTADTKLLEMLCASYTSPRFKAFYFFFILFSEDGRWSKIKNSIPISYINEHKDHLKYMSDEQMFRNIFDHFSNDLVIKNNIKHGVVVKECKESGAYYLDGINHVDYERFNLYFPYYQLKITKDISNDEALELLVKYSKLIGKCPTINELDNPCPSIENTIKIVDLWVNMPDSRFYKERFESIRKAYKLAVSRGG
jgi:hypothetical protein